MKTINFQCRNCGHPLSAPEGSKSVLCGKCTHWNVPGKKSIQQKFGEMEETYDNENQTINDIATDDEDVSNDSSNPEEDDKKKKKTSPLSFLYLAIVIISSIFVYIRDHYKKEIDKILNNSELMSLIVPLIGFVIMIAVFLFIKKGLAEMNKRNNN